ncbi:transglycosylase SLT domain-containing protein [Modestobacter sp. I12A-02662]|uniref:aggregation-promoting factor C-terminal-like domain-containing protein n=1 Tax=Modestobacter sp. I12A-02662 TaxID=1730496 RepID=UPI0034DE8D27
MSHGTNAHTSIEQVPATDVHALAEADATVGTDSPRRSRRTPAGFRRPAIYLAAAAAGAIMVNVLATSEPAAQATAEPVSVAATLGLTSQQSVVADGVVGERLGELAAQRSQREGEQAAAAAAQAAADQAAAEAKAAEEARLAAEAKAAEEARLAAEAQAAEEAAAARAAKEESPAPRSGSVAASGSYQDYALAKVGGDSSQFSCLENLWGKESGWNPNAQNPSSTAYGIPQFLNSTWASTGIAKTSDPYRQIDAGLIYIESRYGSPCSAWSHSKAKNWY